MPLAAADANVARDLERIIHRVKRSMQYRGSYSTRDILDSLVARWVQSGEWERLKQLPDGERHLGRSVRHFILDRFAQLRGRGDREDIDLHSLAAADDESLAELVAQAELRVWIDRRIDDLVRGIVDPRVRIRIASPAQIGRALRLQLDGQNQREIADTLDLSLGLVNKRIADGVRYLVLLQSIENELV